MIESLAYASLTELQANLRAGEVSCEAVTGLMLDRIRALNPGINCYLDIFDRQALDTARVLDRELGEGNCRGPLHGVPIAVKDIFDFPGHQASGGSTLPRDKSDIPATVVEKLRAAGAILLGTLNLDELAAGGSGDNAYFGRCRNPWNPAHNSGGSSGGSAAAVAAGLAYATIGSDAGGSIRIPAAFCGSVGLKPTYGRVSRAGALARTWSMDCIGPITRSTQDIAIVLNAILGIDRLDPSSVYSDAVECRLPAASAKSLPRIGVFESGLAPLDSNFGAGLERLESAGYRLRQTPIPDLETYTGLQQVIVKSEGAAMHGRALRDTDSRMSHAVRSVIEGGLQIPAVRYIEALSLRQSLLQSFCENVMRRVEVLVLPVSVPTAPAFAAQDELEAAEIDREFSRTATLTRFANYLGVPALTLPTGVDADGLPTALQLVGKPFDESLLLQVGKHFESLRGPIVYPDETTGK